MSVWFVVFFKQKAAYEMRISDWSSDVCSSDLEKECPRRIAARQRSAEEDAGILEWLLGGGCGRRQIAPALARRRLDLKEFVDHGIEDQRSEEHRVGKECVGTCRSRWLP